MECYIESQPEEQIKTFVKKRDKILDNFNNIIKNGNLEDTDCLYKSIDMLYEANDGDRGFGVIHDVFSKDIEYMMDIIEQVEKNLGYPYHKDFVKFDEEEINGYKMYKIEKNLMDRLLFKSLSALYDDDTMTDEEFGIWFFSNICSEWGKQQPNGEFFGGFYDDETCENAWDLTRQQNLDELIKLPYSRKLICKTIKIGCNNRMESVRYTNFMCEWIKRKKKSMEN
jgi:hypothetical protein